MCDLLVDQSHHFQPGVYSHSNVGPYFSREQQIRIYQQEQHQIFLLQQQQHGKRRHSVDQLEFSPDSTPDLPSFLRKTRLHKYTDILLSRNATLLSLLQLTREEQLTALGVHAQGARRRMFLSLQRYKQQAMAWASMQDTSVHWAHQLHRRSIHQTKDWPLSTSISAGGMHLIEENTEEEDRQRLDSKMEHEGDRLMALLDDDNHSYTTQRRRSLSAGAANNSQYISSRFAHQQFMLGAKPASYSIRVKEMQSNCNPIILPDMKNLTAGSGLPIHHPSGLALSRQQSAAY